MRLPWSTRLLGWALQCVSGKNHRSTGSDAGCRKAKLHQSNSLADWERLGLDNFLIDLLGDCVEKRGLLGCNRSADSRLALKPVLTVMAGPVFPVAFGCMVQTIIVVAAEKISVPIPLNRISVSFHGRSPLQWGRMLPIPTFCVSANAVCIRFGQTCN